MVGRSSPQEAYPGSGLIAKGHILTPEKFADFLSAAQLTSTAMGEYNIAHRQPANVCYRLIGGDFLEARKSPRGIRAVI